MEPPIRASLGWVPTRRADRRPQQRPPPRAAGRAPSTQGPPTGRPAVSLADRPASARGSWVAASFRRAAPRRDRPGRRAHEPARHRPSRSVGGVRRLRRSSCELSVHELRGPRLCGESGPEGGRRPVQARLDRPERDVQGDRDVGEREVRVVDEREDRPLLVAQAAKRPLDLVAVGDGRPRVSLVWPSSSSGTVTSARRRSARSRRQLAVAGADQHDDGARRRVDRGRAARGCLARLR